MLSLNACAMAPPEFSAPGPPWVMITPNFCRLFMREYPSAAMMAPRSWRNMVVLIPSWAACSMRLLDG